LSPVLRPEVTIKRQRGIPRIPFLPQFELPWVDPIRPQTNEEQALDLTSLPSIKI